VRVETEELDDDDELGEVSLCKNPVLPELDPEEVVVADVAVARVVASALSPLMT
jgi:hypothetical protein